MRRGFAWDRSVGHTGTTLGPLGPAGGGLIVEDRQIRSASVRLSAAIVAVTSSWAYTGSCTVGIAVVSTTLDSESDPTFCGILRKTVTLPLSLPT